MLTKIISDAAHLRVFWVWYAKKYLSHLKDHLKVHSMPVKYEDSWRRPFYFPHRHLTATAGVGNHLDRLHLQLHFWIFDQAASLTLFSTWFSTLYIVPFDSLLPVFTFCTLDCWQNENLAESWNPKLLLKSLPFLSNFFLHWQFRVYLHFACVCCQPVFRL